MKTSIFRTLALATMAAITMTSKGQTLNDKIEKLSLTIYDDNKGIAYDWSLALNDNDNYALRIDTVYAPKSNLGFIKSGHGEFGNEIAKGVNDILVAGKAWSLNGSGQDEAKALKKIKEGTTEQSWTLDVCYSGGDTLKAGGMSLKGKKMKVARELNEYLKGYLKEMEQQKASKLEEERLKPQGLERLPDSRIKYVSYSYNGGMVNLQIDWTVLNSKDGNYKIEYMFRNGMENINAAFDCEENLEEVLRPIFQEGNIVKYKKNYDDMDLHALDEAKWRFSVRFEDDTWIRSSGTSTMPEDDSAIRRTDEYLQKLASEHLQQQ